MRIITVSREFGSGGRELARRLADALSFSYYDQEIIEEIAAQEKLDAGYVARTPCCASTARSASSSTRTTPRALRAALPTAVRTRRT